MTFTDSLKRETGLAIRPLARSPGFTLIVLVTLALGIGATTAIFTMLDCVVLKALPYVDANRLVWLDSPTPVVGPDSRWGLSVAGFFDFKQNAHTLEDVAAVMPMRATITGKRAAERVPAVAVSASIFDVLRLRPMLGRALVEADDLPSAVPVCLISYNYWKTRLNSDPKVVGSVIMVAARPMQIVGVMGDDATIPDVVSPRVDLWVPAPLNPSAQPENAHYLPVVGRLAPGATVASTQAKDIQIGQVASIDTRNELIPGRVIRIDPGAHDGTVAVDVALDGPLPKGARPDLSVDGTIELDRLKNVLYTGRPVYGDPGSVVGLFKLSKDGKEAVRVNVKLGRESVNMAEIVQGLQAGDKIITSDMSESDTQTRVRLQ